MVKCRVLYKWNLFRFGQILRNLACTFSAHHEKSFVPESFKVSIDHVIDYLESGKRQYCFVKKSGNSLEFWIPKSVQTLHIYKWLDFLGVRFSGRIHKRICDLVWILRQQKKGKSEKRSFTMTMACPHAPRNEKKRGKRQTDPRDEDKKEKQQA